MCGDALVFCNEPAVFSDMNELTTGVTDLVVRRDEELDQIFVLINGTPRVMEYGSQQGGWTVDSVPGATGSQDRMIRGDVDGDGSDDLVAYSSNTSKVTGFRFQSASSNSVQEYFNLNVPNGILDVACLNWNGDGDAEIALLTANKVEIFDQAGAQQASFSCPSNTSHLTVFRNAGETEDRLAWFWEVGTKNVEAKVVYASGQEGPYFLPSYGLAGVTTGDYNADGLTDLVLSARTRAEGIVLVQADWWHKASTDSFTGTSGDNLTFHLDTQVTASARACAAVLVDLNNDQDLDLVQPDQYADEIAMFMSDLTYLPTVQGVIIQDRVILQGWDENGNQSGEPRMLFFDVFGPSYAIPEIGVPTELSVTVYVADSLSGVFSVDQVGTHVFPAQWGQNSTTCVANVGLDMPHLNRGDGRVYCLKWCWVSDARGEDRFYPSYTELFVNSPTTALVLETWPGFRELETLVDPVSGGGGQQMARPQPAPVFGPQPVCGTGRVPVPEPPPL